MNTLPAPRPSIKAGSRADLAFALMVMAAYFATFSSVQDASLPRIGLMVGAGIAYVTIGIYGYAYVAQTSQRWLPLLYFTIQVPLGGWIIYMGRGAGFNFMVLLPLAGQSAMLLPQAWVYITNAAIILTYVISLFTFTHDWAAVWANLQILLAGQVFIVAFTQMALNEEKARIEVEQLARDLTEANQRLRQYALQVEQLAISKERNRMAREIHDGLGHYLTTIHMQIQAAEAILESEPQRSHKALAQARGLTQTALADVRRSVAALRVPLEEDLPLPDQLNNLLQDCQDSGFQVDLKIIGPPRPLPAPVHLTLFRAVQEGLNNTSKHAQASQVWITLDYSEVGCVRLTMRDNGIGIDESQGSHSGFGLVGLQERVHLLQGDLRLEQLPVGGFGFEICLPNRNLE
jgi:signal transduction histidine kinase